MALVSLPVCFAFGEYYAIGAFLWTAFFSLGIGQLVYRLFRKASEEAHLRHAMLTVALSWGLVPLFGAIPFLLIASHLARFPLTPLTVLKFQEPWNAVFESFSGFTSTGLSMALYASELPRSLQWWRSFTEWIGGVGMIVLVLSVLEPITDPYQLYYAEGRQKKIALTVTGTVRKIWKIYLLYTVLSVLLLRWVGMPWWEALNHGVTGIATGGFSVKDDSIGAYDPIVQLAVILIMIAGAISFSAHYQLLYQRRLSALWQNAQHRTLWLLLVLGTLVLLLENYSFQKSFLWLDSLFQWVSALATCGFDTTDLQRWSPGAKLFLSLGMVFGAASGSTAGGLKLSRLVSLYKGVLWRFQRLSLRPHQLMRYELEGEVLTEPEASRQIESAAVLGVLWVGLLGIGVMLLLQVVLPKYTLSDVILEAASALGSVGLSTGITHPDLHWLGKLLLILFMWMGRLEIVPVLVLFFSLLRPLKQAMPKRR
ncbi:MAG: TrkH family potassium uptake protein [Cyanobacteriota bacterium]